MLVSPRKNGLTSLNKEVRGFKGFAGTWSTECPSVSQVPSMSAADIGPIKDQKTAETLYRSTYWLYQRSTQLVHEHCAGV